MRDEHEKSSFSLLWSGPTLIIIIAMEKEMNGNEFNLVRFVRFAIHPNFCHHLNYEILRLKHRISMHRGHMRREPRYLPFVDIRDIQSELR